MPDTSKRRPQNQRRKKKKIAPKKKQLQSNSQSSTSTMRPASGRSRSNSVRSRASSAKGPRTRSRSRSRSPTKQATMNSTSEPNFLYETGTLGSGFQSLGLSGTMRETYTPQFSMRGIPPETFIRMVRETFQRQPEVYKKFVKILSQVERADVDKLDLIKRVITLFDGYPHLIEGFNTFLPSEYSIEIQDDAVVIKVYDALGTNTSRVDTGHSRNYDPLGWYETSGTSENSSTIAYVQRVKEMYADQPHKYRQFTDILRDFHTKNVDEIGTIHKIVTLFHQYPHLIVGFNAFLPLGYHVYLNDDGYDVEYPGDNEGERTIMKFKK